MQNHLQVGRDTESSSQSWQWQKGEWKRADVNSGHQALMKLYLSAVFNANKA